MEGGAIPFRLVDGVEKRWILEKVTTFDRVVNSGDPLVDNEACPQVDMPDLGVPHLALRKPDIVPATAEAGGWIGFLKTFHGRRIRGEDRVSGIPRAARPSIKDR